MQLGFVTGCETKNTISILIQLQEKYLVKKMNLCFVFENFKKASDGVPRDVACWASKKQGVLHS